MVVVFPWAYHQGYNTGPNIVEESLYASERWKTFHQKGLWVKCSRKCAGAGGEGGGESFDLGFAKVEKEGDFLESENEEMDCLPSVRREGLDMDVEMDV